MRFEFRPTGACFDLPPEAAPADRWTVCSNFTFPEGVATSPDGELREYFPSSSLAALPLGLLHVMHDLSAVGSIRSQNVYWIVEDGGLIQQIGDAGVTAAMRTPAGWVGPTGPWQVTGGVLNGIGFVNLSGVGNGLAFGSPGAVGALTTFVPSPNDSFRAARPYKYHVVGLGLWNPVALADFPTRVSWTSAAPPGAFPATWAPAATNEAGSIELADCRGLLVDGGRLGEDFLIYAENSTHVMTYVGGQAVMAFRGVSTVAGAMNRNCWADVGGAHFLVTGADVVLMDSNGPKSIAAGWVRRHLFGPDGVLVSSRRLYTHVLHNRARNEVWLCYPAQDQPYCTDALTWSVATGAWGHRTLPQGQVAGAAGRTTLSDLRAKGDQVLMVASRGPGAAPGDGSILLADEPAAGPTWPSRLAVLGRHDLDLGEPDQLKQVTWVRPRFRELATGGTNWQVRAGARNSATESIAWGAWQTYAPATDDAVAISGVVGRLVAVEMRANLAIRPWQLVGLDIDYELRGRW